MADSVQAAIKHAIRAAAFKLLLREELAADLAERIATEMAAREDAMWREFCRLKKDRPRDAATLTARQFAYDRLDPLEVESIAQKLRNRWREENAGAAFAGRKTV